jgi:hypothetical protein
LPVRWREGRHALDKLPARKVPGFGGRADVAMSTGLANTYENGYARSRDSFERNTREHELTVLRDDGLYRHLRCKAPDTISYYFDVVTWPGYLAIVGDCGDFVFSRIRDMFNFFGAEHGINPDYWAQKLQAPRPERATEFSHDAFHATLMGWADDQCEDFGYGELLPYPSLIRGAIEQQIFRDYVYVSPRDGLWIVPSRWEKHYSSFEEAREALKDLEGIDQDDYLEWGESFREYDFHFLWCCFAIVWAIEQYRGVGLVAA